jgi:hypothetical protein
MQQNITTFDEKTGEILSEKQRKYNIFDEDKGYLFKANAYQKRMYNEIKLSDIVKDRTDFGRVHLLAENIYKDTNTIMIRVNSRVIRIAEIEDISKIISLSIKKTKEFISRMKKIHILAERIDKVGDLVQIKYILNPLFFNSKKYLSADLYFLFQESLNCYLPNWVVCRFHEIGNIRKEKDINIELK